MTRSWRREGDLMQQPMEPQAGMYDPADYGYQQPSEPQGFMERLVDDPLALTVGATTLGLALTVLLLIAILRSFLKIARPNEALVFSGKTYTQSDGTRVGYRVLTQGQRAVRIPVLERVDRMDMRLLPIDIVVQNAYSSGNIPAADSRYRQR